MIQPTALRALQPVHQHGQQRSVSGNVVMIEKPTVLRRAAVNRLRPIGTKFHPSQRGRRNLFDKIIEQLVAASIKRYWQAQGYQIFVPRHGWPRTRPYG